MCTRRHQYSVDSTISSETTLTFRIFIPNPPWHEVIISMIEMLFFSFLNALVLFRRRGLLHCCCKTLLLNKSISQKKIKKLLYAGFPSSQTLKHVAISGPLKPGLLTCILKRADAISALDHKNDTEHL